jgi:hypothetical protein
MFGHIGSTLFGCSGKSSPIRQPFLSDCCSIEYDVDHF